MIIHWLFYIDYLYNLCYLHLQLWLKRRRRIQKQSPEVFQKFCKFHMEISGLESLFYKIASLQVYSVIKKETPTQVFSCENWEIVKNTYFEKLLWTTASVYWLLHHILIFTIYYTAYSFLQVTSSLLGIKTRIIGAWGGFFWRSIMNEIFIFWRAFEFPGPRPFAQPPASASSPGPQFVFTSPGS